jgi:homoserine kinase type II
MDISNHIKILRNWRVEPKTLLETSTDSHAMDLPILHIEFEDMEGRRWVLEKITSDASAHKLAIAEILETLANHDMEAILPYGRNTLGQFITRYAGQLCMLRPLSKGITVNQKAWFKGPWRAEALAGFLTKLQCVAEACDFNDNAQAFSVIALVQQRMDAFLRHRPDVARSLDPVFQGLEKTLFPIIDRLPAKFCHGDFQPRNLAWGEGTIASIVGWEHCGIKPEGYDAATMVGALGFDNPDALINAFTRRFIGRLRDEAPYAAISWQGFYDLVIAIRFGWLTEWIRTNNEKARDLEMLYMNLLTAQKDYILKKWGLPDS